VSKPAQPPPRVVKAKRKCCKSGPRCKRCPVVCKRLAKADLAERVGKRRWALSPELRKRDLKRARKRVAT
jgi:hypothetical protein